MKGYRCRYFSDRPFPVQDQPLRGRLGEGALETPVGGCWPPRTELSRLWGYRGFSPCRPAHTLVLLGAWGQAWRGGKAPFLAPAALLSRRESVSGGKAEEAKSSALRNS